MSTIQQAPFQKTPQEVVEMIVDCLEHDKTALIACSELSGRWLSRTRHHLFRHVVLEGDRSQMFLQLLCYSSSFINPTDIRSVTILGGSPATSVILGQSFLRSVHKLHMSRFSTLDTVFYTRTTFIGIAILHLTEVDVHSYTSFFHIISAIHNLRSLTLLSCFWPDQEPTKHGIDYPKPPHGWNSIVLDSRSSQFAEWMVRRDIRPRFSCFHIVDNTLESEQYPEGWADMECASYSIDASNSTKLKHLYLSNLSISDGIQCAERLLGSLLSTVVETISLSFHTADSTDRRMDWSPLERVLLEPRFCTLRTLEVEFDPRVPLNFDATKCFASLDLTTKVVIKLRLSELSDCVMTRRLASQIPS